MVKQKLLNKQNYHITEIIVDSNSPSSNAQKYSLLLSTTKGKLEKCKMATAKLLIGNNCSHLARGVAYGQPLCLGSPEPSPHPWLVYPVLARPVTSCQFRCSYLTTIVQLTKLLVGRSYALFMPNSLLVSQSERFS